MADVYFLPLKEMNPEGFGRLASHAGQIAPERGTSLVAVKIHPGEEGNTTFISPGLVGMIVDALKLPVGKTFLTDTTVLYGGRRMSAPDYHLLAHNHGFRMPDLPPFIVADGLRGTSELKVELPSWCSTRSARLASVLGETDAAVVISHFKGHLLAGFGGAIKNLGMGLAARGGKLFQHSSVKPKVKEKNCTGCGTCARFCGSGALTMESGIAVLNSGRCTGCGECLQRCPYGAIGVNWNQEAGEFITRMTEYALAVTLTVKVKFCVNFLLNVTPDCDCMKSGGHPMVADIGVLGSRDPVSLDQASLDMVTAAETVEGSPVQCPAGTDKFTALRPQSNGSMALEIAERIGLGSRKYRLVEV
jgi:uncharacterized Fe-S center protein